MIKNTSYDTYIQITEGESMGYIVLQARTSHNYFMTVKPWKLTQIVVHSNLIDNSFVKESMLENGTLIDESLQNERFLDENLDITLNNQYHSVDNIPHDHLKENDWEKFSGLILDEQLESCSSLESMEESLRSKVWT